MKFLQHTDHYLQYQYVQQNVFQVQATKNKLLVKFVEQKIFDKLKDVIIKIFSQKKTIEFNS